MLVRNLRTGVESELREGVARAMIKLGKVEEVKPVVEKEEEKPKPEQKKEFFLFETISDNGIQNYNAQNYGIF